MESFANALKSLGLIKLTITGIVLSSVAGVLLLLVNHISEPDMALLYGDLDVGEAGNIVAKLEEQKINAQLKGGGTQIYVPIDMVGKLRMDLAEAGLPNGGSVGYEIFDKSESFGSSIFVQNLNRVRALEGELSRTIRTISQISSARVHLVIPKKEIFSKDKLDPTASIVLQLKTPGRLDNSRVKAVQHLVSSAVPGLSIEKVSIIDGRGNLLSSGSSDQSGSLSTKMEEYRESYENRLERSVDALLGRTLGVGKVRTEVSAEIDLDRLTENSEIYDPEGQVIRSTQTVQDGTKANEANSADVVGSEMSSGDESGSGAHSNESTRSEETINYEISKTTRMHVKESGAVKKLSVAVLIDGIYENVEGAAPSYKARSAEEIEKIKKLVKSAIGFDEKRGDLVEVINMQFLKDPIGDVSVIEAPLLGLEKHHIIRIAETFILMIFGLFMLLLVVRPLLTRFADLGGTNVSGNENQITEQDNMQQQNSRANQTTSINQTPANDTSNVYQASNGNPQANISQQIDGELEVSTVKQITNIVDKYPNESVNMVRNWMNQ